MKAIKLSRFEPILGHVQLLDASFPLDSLADDGASLPGWMVGFEAEDPSGTRTCYGAFFEPFDGRLDGLISWLPGQRPDTPPGHC